jgi:hypothetical protein
MLEISHEYSIISLVNFESRNSGPLYFMNYNRKGLPSILVLCYPLR